jgi:TonB-dependent starch-binding outer membrane protein SusC
MKKCFLSFIILVASGLLLSAQNRQLQGKVTDDTGAPLAGVSVLVKGSKTGV